jgi:uncharacterized paraquat-inducible protein A
MTNKSKLAKNQRCMACKGAVTDVVRCGAGGEIAKCPLCQSVLLSTWNPNACIEDEILAVYRSIRGEKAR